MNTSLDFSEVYSGLKDFQRNTVEYVFRRLYLDDPPAERFLVADEVGLGKTLVARGVIAKAAEHLDRQGVGRIDVVYICSNADIARQNIRRLRMPGVKQAAFASRLTMLPLHGRSLGESRVNLVSFTPSTALDLKGNMGRKEERALLYWLLKRKWPKLVGTKKGPLRVFQGGVASLERFRGLVRRMLPELRLIDPGLRDRFFDDLDRHDREAARRGEPGLEERFEELARAWAHDRAKRSSQERHQRAVYIGHLRALLARTCVETLKPDLVILDEFQRFRHLLDDGSEASELAHHLFNYTHEDRSARVLLLSATPYKMYTVSEESETDNHYSDFVRTTGFLMNGDTEAFRRDLSELGRHLTTLDPARLEPVLEVKRRVESALRSVMCRTERLAVGADRDGMLTEIANTDPQVAHSDFLNYVALDRAAQELDTQHPLEYWKSAPYFPNFWDGYQIGRRFQEAISENPDLARRVRTILAGSDGLLSWDDIRTYREVDPGNNRLRKVTSDVLESGAWKLLWLPPSLPYYRLGGPFKTADPSLTKRLVFSSWNVVPKVVSTIISYEAERRMMTSHKRARLENSPEGRERFTEPLRFPNTGTTGMSAAAFVYPSPTLAELADPLELARELTRDGQSVTRDNMMRVAEDRLVQTLDEASGQVSTSYQGPVDTRWYWVAPLLLDARLESQDAWLAQRDLATVWTGPEGRAGGAGFQRHLDLLLETHDQIRSGTLTLGARPDDLGHVLSLRVVGGPATAALRSLRRLLNAESDEKLGMAARNAAARVAWGFRSLFNTPEVTQLIRGLYTKGPYWRRALTYCVDGGLQAVLDEYIHVLREFRGIVGEVSVDDLETLAGTMAEIISLRSADLHAHDPIDEDEPVRRMRCRFALPFGQHRSEEEGGVRRADFVRTAFNSPFWPFVLTTTSVGQEGLDFHLYCHAVVHWNIPANPVDLEQREGRVHRYMGHAVRKNLAAQHGKAVFNTPGPTPWGSMLDAAEQARSGESDLVPYWVYPGPAKIERHVPRLPLSSEERRLVDLKRSLALYRLAFGQPRQEELVELIRDRVGYDDKSAQRLIDTIRIDLTPDHHRPVGQ